MLNSIAALYGTGAVASTTAYESIATVNVGSGGSANITFTSIPSTYTHLQLRGIVQNVGSGTSTTTTYLNTDTTATNYYSHYLRGTGSAASAGAANATSWNFFSVDTAGSSFSAVVMDILDYTSTAKNKTVRTLSGWDNNGVGNILFASMLWNNTSAINKITLTADDGIWRQYSQFALYGVK